MPSIESSPAMSSPAASPSVSPAAATPSAATPPASVVVVGSINIDVVTHTPAFPAPGETVNGLTVLVQQGGKGANQALAAARAGAAVTFIGAVGTGAAFGEFDVLAPLREAGITTAVRQVEGATTGFANVTVSADAENTLIVIAGANGAISELSEAELGTIAAADVVVLQLEIPMPAVIAAARAARGTVVLNPSPVQELPRELIEAVDVIIVNEGEAADLGDSIAGVPHRVTTLGADGARWEHGGQSVTLPALDLAANGLTVVDTTGAGDSFAGNLAATWTVDPTRALTRAIIAGGLATTRPGAFSPLAADIDVVLAAPPLDRTAG